jgi:hypothetical protein
MPRLPPAHQANQPAEDISATRAAERSGSPPADAALPTGNREVAAGAPSTHGASQSIRWIAGIAGSLILISLLGQLLGRWSGPHGKGLGSVGPRDWLAAVVFTAIGIRIATHRRDNLIGWLFLLIGLFSAIAACSGTYAKASIAIAWIRQWAFWPAYGLLPLVLLLFPDGRLPSRRWRVAAWMVGAGVAIPTVGLAVAALRAPTDLMTSEDPQPLTGWAQAAILVATFGLALTVAGWGAAIAGLYRRWRRARGDEHQQLKWLVSAGAVTLIALTFEFFMEGSWSQPGLWLTGAVGAIAIPVAVGVAILKYHLYAIDWIIHRTLVYGLLTAVLGLGYAGVVLMLGQLFGGVTGDPPAWAVAGATLTVAALFQPARRRIQAIVDRRFNRRRYDAAKIIEAYGVRLHDEIDLDTLSAELLTVVDQAMEPTHISLWLQPYPHGSSATARAEARPTSWAY